MKVYQKILHNQPKTNPSLEDLLSPLITILHFGLIESKPLLLLFILSVFSWVEEWRLFPLLHIWSADEISDHHFALASRTCRQGL